MRITGVNRILETALYSGFANIVFSVKVELWIYCSLLSGLISITDYVLGQDALLSQCLSPLRNIHNYEQIMCKCQEGGGGGYVMK